MVRWTFIQACGAVGLACSAWNLLGDLYYLDFYKAHLSDDEMGMIRQDFRAGYLFNFNDSNWWISFIAQSGGWMYPIWTFVTVVPLYMGLTRRDGTTTFWSQLVPCTILAYGLIIMGGALHSACVFLTVLPSVYHHAPQETNGWYQNDDPDQFPKFLETAQRRVLQHIMFGCLPGYIACNIGGLWVAVTVHFHDTRFPKSFNLFNPIVTAFVVQFLSWLLPDPFGFFLLGCLGTWGLMVFNIGIVYFLWDSSLGPESISSSLLLGPKGKGVAEVTHVDYNSVQDRVM